MGTFSIWHWLIVLVIVLLLFGAKRLPDLATGLGKSIKNFKGALKEEGEKEAEKPSEPTQVAQNQPSNTQNTTQPHEAPKA